VLEYTLGLVKAFLGMVVKGQFTLIEVKQVPVV